MKHIFALAVAVALVTALAIAAPAPAAAEDMLWLDIEFPPFYIHQGPYEGNGIGDRIIDLLIENLPDLEHQRRTASPARIAKELADGNPACSVAFIRTPEREATMVFSTADLFLPPNGITVRRADLERFGGGQPVSFAKLLADPTLRLGAAEGRSYGAPIDRLLDPARGPHVYRRLGEDIYRSLVQMLVRGRLDYVLGYPYEARYVAEELGIADQIVSVPLVENEGYTLAHVVCPRTPWGHKMIARIDRILARERTTDRYRDFVERWLDPAYLPDYREAYARDFLGVGDRD